MEQAKLTAEQQVIIVAVGRAADPHTSVGLLDVLAAHDDHRVRCAVAANPRTPAYLMRALAHDPLAVVRRTVASSPNAPTEVLCSTAQDADGEVRNAARTNLRHRTRLAHDCDCGKPHHPSIT